MPFDRAAAKRRIVVPFTLLVVFVLLYLTLRRFDEAAFIVATFPLSLIGGFRLIYERSPRYKTLDHSSYSATSTEWLAPSAVANFTTATGLPPLIAGIAE